MSVRKIDVPLLNNRVETGSLQINDDWPGLFIRGDNCIFFKMMIKEAINILKSHKSEEIVVVAALEGLEQLLKEPLIMPNLEK